MILFLVIAVLGVCAWFNYNGSPPRGYGRALRRFEWVGFVFSSILGLAFSFMAVMVTMMATASDVPIRSDLRALSDTASVSGSFFLGSGSVDEEPVFFYYREIASDVFVMDYVDADRAAVIETQETPYMIMYCEDYGADWVWFPFDKPEGVDCNSRSEVHFYVPPGSVTNQYNLDLEK